MFWNSVDGSRVDFLGNLHEWRLWEGTAFDVGADLLSPRIETTSSQNRKIEPMDGIRGVSVCRCFCCLSIEPCIVVPKYIAATVYCTPEYPLSSPVSLPPRSSPSTHNEMFLSLTWTISERTSAVTTPINIAPSGDPPNRTCRHLCPPVVYQYQLWDLLTSLILTIPPKNRHSGFLARHRCQPQRSNFQSTGR